MTDTLAREHHDTAERTRSPRIPLLHKFRHKKSDSHSRERNNKLPFSHPSSLTSSNPTPGILSRCPSISGVRETSTLTDIANEYSNLRDAIVSHVRKFYSPQSNHGPASQSIIEHASTGMILAWPQVRSLLGDSTSTLATLSLCITWTILSRGLLLKLGISNSPGCSFLPPEIVECFQSFCLGIGAVTLEGDEESSFNFALLSRWKQISATLLHSTYTTDAFTHFDSRTVNIERALKALDPLLSAYAIPLNRNDGLQTHSRPSQDARLSDLRDVLKLGARFAFTLFSQPSFWKFDWTSDRAIEHGKQESQMNLGRVPNFNTAVRLVVGTNGAGGHGLTKGEIVVWPRLVRVMDGEGVKLEDGVDGGVFGGKKYLSDFGKA
ncbi:hypothetical protein CC80DRAFT_281640 [Byssothecium circinans]|uniref:Uncharacterized protein n=1 Tax=Byssothecium circinans TaxID=147558 RepID=A0A6A5T9V1_9PLEO|nr:hypothetical protein CC80DRAFT_281640 [Byssothecium circinans]